ncbi:MAG: hypothetical protein ACI8S6_002525 [Myxococcota bacterium]|jgi:hypothetical protein
MSRRYKYNKHSGALQEATPKQQLQQQQSQRLQQAMTMNAPMDLEDSDDAPVLTNQMQTRRLVERSRRPSAATAAEGALDPSQNRGRSGMFFYTVEEGQQVLSVDQHGAMTVIKGPRRVWSPGRRFRPMQHYVAHPGEFLIVRFRDGQQKHLPGPSHCWLDPREHLSIERTRCRSPQRRRW